MPFVRRKRGQVLLVHNRRLPAGRTEQVVLHTFSAPGELRGVLDPGERWTAWRDELEWRHPGHAWRWPELRGRLRKELEAWEEGGAPGGAVHRKAELVRRLADELGAALRVVSPAGPADAVLLEVVRQPLESLQSELGRLLGDSHGLSAPAPVEVDLDELGRPPDDADRIFDEGMERWWAGDRRGALRLYRKALERDPAHADAHTHIGIERYERGRFQQAERDFRAAIEGGLRHVVRDGARIEWGHLENRPYLRGLSNLALALSRQGRWEETVELWEQLLRLNPDDNQGIRFLLGEGYLRLGRPEDAIRACERGLGDPGACFDLALALHASDRPLEVGMPLLLGFATNRYVAPMLLGERWRRLDGFHATSMAEPEWARDYVDRQGDMWRRTPGSAELLRRWWCAEAVQRWRSALDDVVVRLGALPVGEERDEVVALGTHLQGVTARADVVRAVEPTAVIGPTIRGGRKPRARGRSTR